MNNEDMKRLAEEIAAMFNERPSCDECADLATNDRSGEHEREHLLAILARSIPVGQPERTFEEWRDARGMAAWNAAHGTSFYLEVMDVAREAWNAARTPTDTPKEKA